VRLAPGIPHALCFIGAKISQRLGRITSRECEGLSAISSRYCEERSVKAIHSFFAPRWIASLALAMMVGMMIALAYPPLQERVSKSAQQNPNHPPSGATNANKFGFPPRLAKPNPVRDLAHKAGGGFW
jgi:hypothetical protein